MEHESNIQKLDFAVLVPQAQRGDSMAVNSLLLGFTPMVRAFKYNSYYVHYLEPVSYTHLTLPTTPYV